MNTYDTGAVVTTLTFNGLQVSGIQKYNICLCVSCIHNKYNIYLLRISREKKNKKFKLIIRIIILYDSKKQSKV